MSDVFQGFDTRLKKIDQKRTKLAKGYVSRVGRDGLIVLRPKRQNRSFPIRGSQDPTVCSCAHRNPSLTRKATGVCESLFGLSKEDAGWPSFGRDKTASQ